MRIEEFSMYAKNALAGQPNMSPELLRMDEQESANIQYDNKLMNLQSAQSKRARRAISAVVGGVLGFGVGVIAATLIPGNALALASFFGSTTGFSIIGGLSGFVGGIAVTEYELANIAAIRNGRLTAKIYELSEMIKQENYDTNKAQLAQASGFFQGTVQKYSRLAT